MPQIPLRGLIHRADIIRYPGEDDGAGGIKKGDPVTIYSSRRCRLSVWDGEEARPRDHGFVAAQEFKGILEYSPLVLDSDFLKVSWGTIPNVAGAGGDTFSPKVDITTSAGGKTLTWNFKNGLYSDVDGDYTVSWNGSAWEFVDSVAVLTVEFDGHEQHHNIFNLDWSDLVGVGYSVDSQYGDPRYYRIMEYDHKFDDLGNPHHTTLRFEEEDQDG